jgi:hypothetical protein
MLGGREKVRGGKHVGTFPRKSALTSSEEQSISGGPGFFALPLKGQILGVFLLERTLCDLLYEIVPQ